MVRRRGKKLKFPAQEECTHQNSMIYEKTKKKFTPSEMKITEEFENDFKISMFVTLKR